MEAKVKALEPQLVRIFYNDDWEERQPNRVKNLASFYWGKYTGTYNSVYAMIGPASEGWPLFPGYHAWGCSSRRRSAAGRCCRSPRGPTMTRPLVRGRAS
jgi:hypothetical protein